MRRRILDLNEAALAATPAQQLPPKQRYAGFSDRLMVT
jgi:hypothetical protein